MLPLPRVALGTVQPEAEVEYVSWALMDLLSRSGCQVQHFTARCCLSPLPGAIAATGLGSRHLDSWLMSPEVCRELLLRGTGDSDLALIEGRYDAGRPANCTGGGSLDQLCHWLDLPRLVVLDVRRLEGCQMPQRPTADGLLLDGIDGAADLSRWQTMLESFWGIPVLGALEKLPRLRDALRKLAPGDSVPRDICEHLGTSLQRYCKPAVIRRLAARRQISPVSMPLFEPALEGSPITVAVAYDDAFHCYFPDTLDMLELLGASIVDFSPLHDESLPPETDLVYIGCGHPERFATELSDNHCMMMALRNHLCAGRRIYADGGGLAYLCQYLETSEGKWAAMVGALPAIAHLNPNRRAPKPVELTISQSSWLADRGSSLRGYLSSTWQIEPNGQLNGYLAERDHQYDLIGRYQALASRMQVNFVTQPGFLRNFVEPASAAVSCSRARTIVF